MSMAMKYGMNKRRKMYDGGEVTPSPTSTATVDPQKASLAAGSMKKAFGYARGGDVSCKACDGGSCSEHGGMVDRVMAKRMSKGGMVANDTDPIVDSMENEFDDLVLRDDLESSYTGANSGDELGNAHLKEDDQDMVARIMRSRSKKDRMPRPA